MSHRRRTWLTVSLALVPFCAAIASKATSVDPRPTPLVQASSPLIFDQYGVSLGEVGPYPAVEAHYTFVNRGNAPITIDRIQPSCGCVSCKLHDDRRTFAPGEAGRLTVRLQTANEQPGDHHYTVEVQSTGKQYAQELLTFRVTLPDRKISVEPREVFFYQLHGQADERTIQLIDYRGSEGTLAVIGAKATSDQVAVEVQPRSRDAQGHFRIPIKLKVPAHVRPGREIAHVWIATTDPAFPRIAVPVLIEGRAPIQGAAATDEDGKLRPLLETSPESGGVSQAVLTEVQEER